MSTNKPRPGSVHLGPVSTVGEVRKALEAFEDGRRIAFQTVGSEDGGPAWNMHLLIGKALGGDLVFLQTWHPDLKRLPEWEEPTDEEDEGFFPEAPTMFDASEGIAGLAKRHLSLVNKHMKTRERLVDLEQRIEALEGIVNP